MASGVYRSFLLDVFNGNINTTHGCKAFLVGSSYAEDFVNHQKRSDVSGEITGTGYVAGGVAVALSVAADAATNSIILAVGSATFPAFTSTFRKMVVYRLRNGVASTEELVCCNDKGQSETVTNTGLLWPASTWRIPMPAPV
jgi:hypothetical protein